jgi:hypothetical protein
MLPPKKITLLPKVTNLLPILQIAKNKVHEIHEKTKVEFQHRKMFQSLPMLKLHLLNKDFFKLNGNCGSLFTNLYKF